MPDFEFTNPAFHALVLPNAPLLTLGEGFAWLEGPVWFADANQLLVSDLPNDRILRWTEDSGVSVFRQPSGFANGHTPRPPRPAHRLLTQVPLHHTHRDHRRDHHPCGQLPGQEAEPGPTMSSSTATAPSGSPTRITAATPTTKAASTAWNFHQASIASTTLQANSPWSPTTSPAPTACTSRPMNRCSTSLKPAHNSR